MGQSLAPAFEKLRDLSSGEALALLKSFRVEGYDFGLDLPKVQRLYDLDDPEAAALLMSAFDTQSSGMISALDLLCGTILYSTGDIDNKLEGIFLAFDFRDSGTVHYDDFVVLLQTCCTALVVMAASPIALPQESAMERLASHAFEMAGIEIVPDSHDAASTSELNEVHSPKSQVAASSRGPKVSQPIDQVAFCRWVKCILRLGESDVGEDIQMEDVFRALESVLDGSVEEDESKDGTNEKAEVEGRKDMDVGEEAIGKGPVEGTRGEGEVVCEQERAREEQEEREDERDGEERENGKEGGGFEEREGVDEHQEEKTKEGDNHEIRNDETEGAEHRYHEEVATEKASGLDPFSKEGHAVEERQKETQRESSKETQDKTERKIENHLERDTGPGKGEPYQHDGNQHSSTKGEERLEGEEEKSGYFDHGNEREVYEYDDEHRDRDEGVEGDKSVG